MITVDIEAAEPLFNQLVRQIKSAVESKQIMAGEPMPSIRALANELDINAKTVAKAYRLLERDNVIETKGYRGTFVHPEAEKNCKFDLNEWLHSEMDQAVAGFRNAGATDSEIRNAFSQSMNK